MREIPHFEIDDHLRIVRNLLHDLDIVDIAVGLADHGGYLGEAARLVERGDGNLGREALCIVLVDVPGHVDPALRLLVERLQRLGMNRIDGDALARVEDADDAVAWDRAVRCEADRQIAAQAPDRDAVCAGGALAFAAAARAGPTELQAHDLAEAEPAFFSALDFAPPLWRLALRVFRAGGLDDVGGGQLTAADGGNDIFRGLLRKPPERLSEGLLAETLAAPAEGALEDFTAEFAILGARRIARGSSDCRARLASDGEVLPSGGRCLHVGGDDLHLVAVPEFGDERHRPSVDLAADAGVADVGVHRIGEVDWIGAARERNQPALGREAEHLILEQLELGVLEKLFRIVAFEQHVDEMPKPAIGVALMTRKHAVLRA